ncbi:MAG: hypothetical protein ACRDK3_13450 [Actinomycetota bacterium]
MSRPKLQSVMMATVRCLLTLCVFGFFMGSQVDAMRTTRRGSQPAATLQASAAASKGKHSFGISGEIEGLYPSARVPLNVRVTNPFDHVLRVRSVEVEVEDSNLGGCGREWVRPRHDVEISTLVPPQATSFLSYPVWMPADAPAACQGATWTLHFRGTGAVAGGQGSGGDHDGRAPDDDSAAPGRTDHGSLLPFTGLNLILIAGLALTSILAGAMMMLRRSERDEA